MKLLLTILSLLLILGSPKVEGQRGSRMPLYADVLSVADSSTLATLHSVEGGMRYLKKYTASDSITTGGWFMYFDSSFAEGGTYAVHSDTTGKQWIRITGFENLLSVLVKTSTYTIKSVECWGSVFTNTGDTGSQVLNLPACTTGMFLEVYLSTAQDININPDDADRIMSLTGNEGDAISSDATLGSYVRLVAISDSVWAATDTIGTWSDVN